MIAFSIMAALMAVLGFEGLRAVSNINNSLDELYVKHMVGATAIHEVKALIPMISGEARQALLDPDSAAREQAAHSLDNYFTFLEENLASAEKTLVSNDDKAAMEKLRQSESEYKTMLKEILRLAVAKQDKAAIAMMAKATATGDEVIGSCAALSRSKEQYGKQAFDDSAKVYASTRMLLTLLLTAAVLAAIGLGWFISQLLAKPLRSMVVVANELAEGHLDQQLDYHSDDEAGMLADAFRRMIAGFSEPVREVAAVLGRVANRDLTTGMQCECKGDFVTIKTSVNTAIENLNQALGEVQKSTLQVSGTAQQLSSATEELSAGAQEQASAQEEASSTIEQITATVKQNAENAQQAKQLAHGSREAAEKGGAVVTAAVSAMSEINASSKRIADIITTIDEIAFQTNLLALNAAVEAARAGEQGRGFAVVASEVRSLAQRSAMSAKEIKGLIQDSVRKVENGASLVNQSGATLHEIVAAVKRVTDIVAEIAAASQEQATGIEQVSKSMARMDQMTQHNSAQTEQLSSTASELSSTAELLQELTEKFELEDSEEEASGRPRAAVVPKERASARSTPASPRRTAELTPGLAQLARATSRKHQHEASPIEF